MSRSVQQRVATQLGKTRKAEGLARNSEVLASFVAYCKAHPEQRFWQALRNWSGWPFVLVTNDLPGEASTDTFYWEGRNG